MSLIRSARRVLTRAAIPLTAVTMSVAAAGCNGDAITAPDRPALRSEVLATPVEVLATPVSANILLRSVPILFRSTATATIGREGGTLSLPGAGLQVVVPPGALSRRTRLSVTADPGLLIAYQFQPHGTVFNVPLVVTQDLANTLWLGNLNFLGLWLGLGSTTFETGLSPSLEAGYFADQTQLDASHARAQVNEILPVTVNDSARTATFNVQHFSGYVIATGHE